MLTDSFVTHQVQRDLQWVINASPIMNPTKCDTDVQLCNLPTLLHLPGGDTLGTPGTLTADFAHRRLGIYYENLVNLLLNSSPNLLDIKRNIQVSEHKRTLGEYDILCRTMQGENLHIECAVKFYLCTGDGSELSHFEGPNRRDRLDIKWNKLINKQLQLSTTHAGRACTDTLGLHPDRKLLLLQGYLFYPFEIWHGDGRPTATLHPLLHTDHNRGWWIRQPDMDAVLTDSFRYQMLNKPFWLHSPDLPTLPDDTLRSELKTIDRPQLIARCTRDGDRWHEHDRGFVVPADW